MLGCMRSDLMAVLYEFIQFMCANNRPVLKGFSYVIRGKSACCPDALMGKKGKRIFERIQIPVIKSKGNNPFSCMLYAAYA